MLPVSAASSPRMRPLRNEVPAFFTLSIPCRIACTTSRPMFSQFCVSSLSRPSKVARFSLMRILESASESFPPREAAMLSTSREESISPILLLPASKPFAISSPIFSPTPESGLSASISSANPARKFPAEPIPSRILSAIPLPILRKSGAPLPSTPRMSMMSVPTVFTPSRILSAMYLPLAVQSSSAASPKIMVSRNPRRTSKAAPMADTICFPTSCQFSDSFPRMRP